MIEVDVEVEAWIATLPDAPVQAEAAAAAALDRPGGVAILLTDDAAMRELNARFRGKDAATNVLSFPSPASAAPHLGDIALAYGVCTREAAEQGKPLAHHLQHLVVHGVLHLLGSDHVDDAEAESMEAREREILSGLGVPDPYAPKLGVADPLAPPGGAQDSEA